MIGLLHRGEEVSHRGKYYGKYYVVREARIYTRREQPVPIYVSGFGEQAADLAGRIGDGYCLATPSWSRRSAAAEAATNLCWRAPRSAGTATPALAGRRRSGCGPTSGCPVSCLKPCPGQEISPTHDPGAGEAGG